MRTPFKLTQLQHLILSPLQWCVILIGLSVPISVAFDNLMLALILLGALFSLRRVSNVAITHPVARAAVMLFVMLFVAMFYGATPLKEALVILVKYIDLAFIPVFIFLLSSERVQRNARYAFMVAMAITLFISYLVGLKILPITTWMHIWTVPGNPAIFHSHITQNNMMAFAVFLALLEWRDAKTRISKLAWGLFATLASINVLFMVEGQTGYVIYAALLAWFAWASLSRAMRQRNKNWGWLQGGLIALLLSVGAVGSYHNSSHLHERVAEAISEYQNWTTDHGNTSIGLRLDFYSNTLALVKDNLLLGVGTGGFPAAFALRIQGTDAQTTHNPHNEYLMISAQTGMIGLGLMLFLFYTHWRYAPLLPSPFQQDAARGLLIAYIINCLFNSALMDHSAGLFFAFMTGVLFSNLKLGSKHD